MENGGPASVHDHLCCGDFWSYLIKAGNLLPQNLSLVGVADYPVGDGNSAKKNKYRDSYLAYEKAGVSFFSLNRFDGEYLSSLTSFLEKVIQTPYFYLSVDLDVGSYESVLAARYMDWPGLGAEDLLQIAGQIRRVSRKKKARLAGLDFMEINQHFLGLEMENGGKDETMPLVAKFMRRILA
jgi:arginase family enzyme